MLMAWAVESAGIWRILKFISTSCPPATSTRCEASDGMRCNCLGTSVVVEPSTASRDAFQPPGSNGAPVRLRRGRRACSDRCRKSSHPANEVCHGPERLPGENSDGDLVGRRLGHNLRAGVRQHQTKIKCRVEKEHEPRSVEARPESVARKLMAPARQHAARRFSEILDASPGFDYHGILTASRRFGPLPTLTRAISCLVFASMIEQSSLALLLTAT